MKNGCSIWSVSERRKRGKNIEQREPRRLPRQRLPLTVLCSLSGLGGRRAPAVTACFRSVTPSRRLGVNFRPGGGVTSDTPDSRVRVTGS